MKMKTNLEIHAMRVPLRTAVPYLTKFLTVLLDNIKRKKLEKF